MHLLALSLSIADSLVLTLGLIVFVRNLIRPDPDFERSYPWWKRLSMYLAILLIPLAAMASGLRLSASFFWADFALGLTALAVPLLGVLGSLWLAVFRRTHERLKFARGIAVAR